MGEFSIIRTSSPGTAEPVPGGGPAASASSFGQELILPRGGGAETAGELHYYWRLLSSRRWLLLGAAILGIAVAAAITFRQPRLYVAQATVEFKRALPPGQDLDMLRAVVSVPPALAKRLLTTKILAARVIDTEGSSGSTLLNAQPGADAPQSLLGAAWSGLRSLLSAVTSTVRLMLGTPSSDGTTVAAPTQPAEWNGVDLDTINHYYSHIDIRPIRGTSLADIVVTHPSPETSAHIANLHARTFIEMDVETKVASLADAQGLLGRQLAEVRAQLEASRRALTDFQLDHGILSLPKDTGTLTRQSLRQLNTLLTEAQGARIIAEADYRSAAAMTPEHLGATLTDDGLQDIRRDILSLQSHYRANAQKYGPNHPDMLALHAHITAKREELAAAALQALARLEAAFGRARAKEKDLRNNLEAVSRTASEEDRELVRLSILQRDVDSNEQLYVNLLEQAKEVDLTSGAFQWTNVKLVDEALAPTAPTYPRNARNILVGLFLALAGGVACCLLIDRLDTSIHTPDDVATLLDLPAYGVIPDFRRLPTSPAYGRRLVDSDQVANTRKDLVTLLHPASVVSEAYRGVRTNLMFSSPDSPPKCVLVTSSQVAEGKTVTVVNLAITLTLSGARVLVLDADLRKASCHTALRVDREPGLSNVLTGQTDLREAVVRSPMTPKVASSGNGYGLFVLPAGRIPPNPAELLASDKMSQLLATLKDEFDFVLIDSPPIIPVTDSVVLATKADGVLMVIRCGEWGRDVVRKGLWHLDAVRAHILGGLLNSVDLTNRGHSYYYYKQYYGYRAYYGKTYGAPYGNPPESEGTAT